MRRAAAATLAFAALFARAAGFEPVVPGKALEFPRDLGAHPGFRIEWWYVTGHLESAAGPLGFQVTFFRVRNPAAEANPSRFAPRQLLFAHAALADPAVGRLLHGERSARAYEGLAEARAGETDVRIDDWALERESGAYRARIEAEGFALDLVLTPTQPVLPEGDGGFSRKGPLASQASEYYSEPQLRVAGRVRARGRARDVTGTAWLDHEWSSEYLAPEAAGWDWLGANLDDGSALMAFRMRSRDGRVLWSQATVRPRGGAAVSFTGDAVRFRPLRSWRSPRTGVTYPVSMEVAVGERRWRLEPTMDDQELDARASTGTLYWEGAVRIAGERAAGGRGYLELTGYADRVPF
ncbi:MAG TPA: lipocalin-like domain-containing protein [Usitatibacter sp.]|nr:lipocalin-like domain-containing protein [Usitatibacter sp.]